MTEKHGIAFDDATWERLDARTADDEPISPFVDRLVWFALDAEAELARRAIHIDDHAERAEFMLDRLEEGLDAWNA